MDPDHLHIPHHKHGKRLLGRIGVLAGSINWFGLPKHGRPMTGRHWVQWFGPCRKTWSHMAMVHSRDGSRRHTTSSKPMRTTTGIAATNSCRGDSESRSRDHTSSVHAYSSADMYRKSCMSDIYVYAPMYIYIYIHIHISTIAYLHVCMLKNGLMHSGTQSECVLHAYEHICTCPYIYIYI